MNSLDYAIIKTVAFFDIFNYSLTATEIWKWLYRPAKAYSLAQVKEALDSSEFLKEKLSVTEGFYSFKGREFICQKRKLNNNLAEKKFAKAANLAKVYRYIPFVKMIAVCNTLAYSNASEESDIDFFIITKSGKIWLARFFTILYLKFFGRRPVPGKNSDAFCLSFYLDEEDLNIRHIMFGNQDIYTPYWVQQLMPIYDPENLYERFLESNSWYRDYLPNGYSNEFVNKVEHSRFSRAVSQVVDYVSSPPFINRWLDSFYRRIQTPIIDRNMKELVNVDTRVIVNDQMLKFHANDRRESYYQAWRNRVGQAIGNYEKEKSTVV